MAKSETRLFTHEKAPGHVVEVHDGRVRDVAGVLAMAAAVAQRTDPQLAQELTDAYQKMLSTSKIEGEVRDGLRFQVTIGGKGG